MNKITLILCFLLIAFVTQNSLADDGYKTKTVKSMDFGQVPASNGATWKRDTVLRMDQYLAFAKPWQVRIESISLRDKTGHFSLYGNHKKIAPKTFWYSTALGNEVPGFGVEFRPPAEVGRFNAEIIVKMRSIYFDRITDRYVTTTIIPIKAQTKSRDWAVRNLFNDDNEEGDLKLEVSLKIPSPMSVNYHDRASVGLYWSTKPTAAGILPKHRIGLVAIGHHYRKGQRGIVLKKTVKIPPVKHPDMSLPNDALYLVSVVEPIGFDANSSNNSSGYNDLVAIRKMPELMGGRLKEGARLQKAWFDNPSKRADRGPLANGFWTNVFDKKATAINYKLPRFSFSSQWFSSFDRSRTNASDLYSRISLNSRATKKLIQETAQYDYLQRIRKNRPPFARFMSGNYRASPEYLEAASIKSLVSNTPSQAAIPRHRNDLDATFGSFTSYAVPRVSVKPYQRKKASAKIERIGILSVDMFDFDDYFRNRDNQYLGSWLYKGQLYHVKNHKYLILRNATGRGQDMVIYNKVWHYKSGLNFTHSIKLKRK